MGKISLVTEKCIHCQTCVGACPRQIFQSNLPQATTIKESLAKTCIECGHCVCLCPTSAITVGSMTPETAIPVDFGLLPSFEQFAALVRYRRSTRKYQAKPVSQEHLDRLFELAQSAPTAKNCRQLKWKVVNNPQSVHQLAKIIIDGVRDNPKLQPMVDEWDAGYDGIHRGAACLVFAYASNSWVLSDAAIAVETLDLGAATLGLGSCWAGFFMNFVQTNQTLRQKLGLAETDRVGGALLLGYPDGENYKKNPFRSPVPVEYLP